MKNTYSSVFPATHAVVAAARESVVSGATELLRLNEEMNVGRANDNNLEMISAIFSQGLSFYLFLFSSF